MKHLVLYSHPSPQSFNHAICEAFVAALRQHGQEVRVRDLYAMAFDPVLKAGEIEGFEKGVVPEDVAREHEHIRWADILTLICPIWWGGLTANLRGYFDRVFSLGFAYEETPDGIKGLLPDKRVFTINTIGAPRSVYEEAGLFRCMDKILDDIVFQFCGLNVAGHHYFCFVDGCTHAERQDMLQEVREIAGRLSRS